MQAQRGFTLIELVVAMALMALTSLGAYQFLSSTTQTAERLGAQQTQLLALQRMQATISRDLGQWVNRPIRDTLGDPLPALLLTPEGALEFTRRGLSNPLDRQRSDLIRVRYELVEGRLVRQVWSSLDRLPGEQPQSSIISPPGLTIRWRVLDSVGGRVVDVWPPVSVAGTARVGANLNAGTPVAVNFDFTLAPWGSLRRVYVMPENDR